MLGAQDVFWEDQGAYTSEVGPAMLRSIGAKYVIVGHSERRKFAKETDAMINKKIALAVRDGLKVILCVGEPLSVREKGAEVAKKFVAQQLLKDLKGISLKPGSLYIAYEPIWAIGTGRSDKPEDAREMAVFIKSSLKKTKHATAKFLVRRIGEWQERGRLCTIERNRRGACGRREHQGRRIQKNN